MIYMFFSLNVVIRFVSTGIGLLKEVNLLAFLEALHFSFIRQGLLESPTLDNRKRLLLLFTKAILVISFELDFDW